VKYISIPNLKQVTVPDLRAHLGGASSANTKRDRHSIALRKSSLNESDFQEEDFESELTASFDAKCFAKHGFDVIMLT